MNEGQNVNYSLLNQEEIDTLVRFLLDKKSNVDSTVLSQESIDKLIQLIRCDSLHMKRLFFDPLAHVDCSLLGSLQIDEASTSDCALRMEIDEATGFIKLVAVNEDNHQTMEITPEIINEAEGKEWGYFISPALFIRIVEALSLKCSSETYEMVCKHFAKYNFGDENHKITCVNLPENVDLIECLF